MEMPAPEHSLDFSVELWTHGYIGSRFRTLARCSRTDVARAAYQQALKAYPKEFIVLRFKGRVMKTRSQPPRTAPRDRAWDRRTARRR